MVKNFNTVTLVGKVIRINSYVDYENVTYTEVKLRVNKDTFIIKASNKLAEIIRDYSKKGSIILIKGTLINTEFEGVAVEASSYNIIQDCEVK